MTARTNESELLQKIIAGNMPIEEERAAVEGLIQRSPQTALSLLPVYLAQKNQSRKVAEESRRVAQELIEKVSQPPLYPATFIRLLDGEGQRALVAQDGHRMAVTLGPDLNSQELRCGSQVLLSTEKSVLVSALPGLMEVGAVGAFSRFHDGRAVLKGPADEECVVDVAPGIREPLKPGDLLLYHRESLVAWEIVGKPNEQACLVVQKPDVTFDDIGGLNHVIEEIMNELTLHLIHPEVARRFDLKLAKGILLWGPPGVGKTMIAKALAHHCGTLHGSEPAFFTLPPGVHRSMWFGKSEQNIRDLFAHARNISSEGRLAFLFFDDCDQLGSRSDHANPIDSRILPSFLHEMDGTESLEGVMVIGATNRPDLVDEALLRRFGSKVFRIQRPDREAARQIFCKHLLPHLPYRNGDGPGEATAATLVEPLLSRLYSPNGEFHVLGTLTLRDASQRPLTAPQIMSGALIANTVAEAKRQSAFRALKGGPVGIALEDLLKAADEQLAGVAARLKPGAGLQQLLELDADVVRVEACFRNEQPRSHTFVTRP